MTFRRLISFMTVIIFSVAAKLILKIEVDAPTENSAEFSRPQNKYQKNKFSKSDKKKYRNGRSIASANYKVEEGIKINDKDQTLYEDFKEQTEDTNTEEKNVTSTSSPNQPETSSFRTGNINFDSGVSNNSSSRSPSSTSTSKSASNSNLRSNIPTTGFLSAPIGIASVSTPKPATPVAELSFSCFTTIDNGTYNSPVSLNINCTRSAKVHYCVGTGGACCDANDQSPEYLSPVVIGDSIGGQFCVNIVATSDKNETTSLTKSYLITNQVPNLQSSQPIVYAQTTELNSYIFLTSQDFGKINYTSSLINLKSHDPGVSGLNLSCDEIALQHSTLSSPNPVNILMDYLVASLNPLSDQIKIPLTTSNLDYGDNYLVSLMTNKNPTPEAHACSTHKFTLLDFEHFNFLPSHSTEASSDIREFSAQFTPYGFFEDTIQQPRTPAGVSEGVVQNQRLESGLYGIFY